MLEKILTVGGYTLLSRLTGFMRDIMLRASSAPDPSPTPSFVAFRLPKPFSRHFRRGAFNAAFIPRYARVRTQGVQRRRAFSATVSSRC